ncbi:hypothetical protein [Antricoccus suffuscus]|uniref:hypothetical protein n=1 Tax=Antricoccus suffuscus TaxID=1629062 RepID=UPI001EDDAB8F|nr:hypothetical protein [Antricoccus suffuscus]
MPTSYADDITGPILEAPKRRPSGGRARSAQRRALAAQRQTENRHQQRRALDALSRASGLPFAIAAVLVLAVLIIVNVIGTDPGTDESGAAATSSAPVSDPRDTGSTAPAAAVPVRLDPHAGTHVLPPQGIPPGPNVGEIDHHNALHVAEAFAREACASTAGESTTEHADRLAPYATGEVAGSWTGGTAAKVRCLQFTASLDPARPATATSTPVVVTAVQVYDAGAGSDLVAYRWRITPMLAVGSDGAWGVSA